MLAVGVALAAWQANGDDIAAFLAAANPARWPLAEMEAMEKEKPGIIALMMDFVAGGGDPKGYSAEVTADTVTFVKRVTEKSASGSGTQTTTVRMIREGNQWKFGKKRS